MSREFLLLVFSWISFPPAPEYSIRTVSNVFKKVAVPLIPAANFSTSFASVVDTGGKFATSVNDVSGKQWEQLTNYWQLKMNLKKKFYLYANSTTQRCPKEIMKILWLKIFPFASQLELRISPRNFAKIWNGLGLGKLIHVENLNSKISWHCLCKLTILYLNFLTTAFLYLVDTWRFGLLDWWRQCFLASDEGSQDCAYRYWPPCSHNYDDSGLALPNWCHQHKHSRYIQEYKGSQKTKVLALFASK